jgi:hypothetical protein
MVCQKCGLVHPEFANYCMHCGTGLRGQARRSWWRRSLLIAGVLLALVGLFFTAFPQPSSQQSAVPAAGAATELPIVVCASDPNWVRPTPEEMADTVWQDNRYRDSSGPSTGSLAYYSAHVFLVPIVTGSGVSHLINMAGLSDAVRNAVPPFDGGCGVDPVRHERLATLQELEVWLIGYEAIGAQLEGESGLVIRVLTRGSLNQGYQIFRVVRPDPVMLQVRFELPTGDLVAEAAGTRLFGPIDVPGWPPSTLR